MEMEKVTKFTLKDVRCFAGEQSVNIRPITLLVGENSTGKSTVLGCYDAFFRVPFDEAGFNFKGLDFNHAPYRMGGFMNIARQSKQKSKKFTLGGASTFDKETVQYAAMFEDMDSDTIASRIKFSLSGGSVTLTVPPAKPPSKPQKSKKPMSGPFNYISFKREGDKRHFVFNAYKLSSPPGWLLGSFAQWAKMHRDSLPLEFKKFWKQNAVGSLSMGGETVISMAPVRSEPRRAYNPWPTSPSPDGSDEIVHLHKIAGGEKWASLHKNLCQFGKDSGMFKDVSIKNLGNEHFQVRIKIGAHNINIVDVGYGVSQLLPILVRMARPEGLPVAARRFLLQQPEVHLHPQAQASLASLLVRFANNGKGPGYLIETHSDYIVDRIRIEIARGNIDPKHVSLAYHEKEKDGSVQIHNIGFDKEGNLVDAPPSYREFFLRESDSLLGFEKE